MQYTYSLISGATWWINLQHTAKSNPFNWIVVLTAHRLHAFLMFSPRDGTLARCMLSSSVRPSVCLSQDAFLLPQTDRATRCFSQNLVNCCTAVGTSCTTNQEQIEVMELEGYSRPTRNKLCAFSNYASIIVCAIHNESIHVNEFCLQRHRHAVAKFSKSRVWDKVPEGSTLIFGRISTRISLKHSVR